MADISAEIAAFQNAVYGEDVRSAMISLANKLNQESSNAASIVTNYDEKLTNLTENNAFDLVKNGDQITTTSNGITFTWSSNKSSCTVNGTSTGIAISYPIFGSKTSLPIGVLPGQDLYAYYSTPNQNIKLKYMSYIEGESGAAYSSVFVKDSIIHIRDDAVGIWLRLEIASGITINNVTVHLAIMTTQTNVTLSTNFDFLKNRLSNMIREYSSANSYSRGQYVFKDNNVLKSKNNIAANTPWNANDWLTVYIDDALYNTLGRRFPSNESSVIDFDDFNYTCFNKLTITSQTLHAPFSPGTCIFIVLKLDTPVQIAYDPTVCSTFYFRYFYAASSSWGNWIARTFLDQSDLRTNIYEALNCGDKLFQYPHNSMTTNGITYTWNLDNTECTVNGTATSPFSYNTFYLDKTHLPEWLSAGQKIYIVFESNNSNIAFNIMTYIAGQESSATSVNIYETGEYTVPNNTIGIAFRIFVPNGVTITNGLVSKCMIVTEKSNEMLTEDVYEIQSHIEEVLPEIYDDEVNNLVNHIQNTDSDLRFIVYSDPHNTLSSNWMKYDLLNKQGLFDGLIGLGDFGVYTLSRVPSQVYSDLLNNFNKISKLQNVFFVNGNHDAVPYLTNGGKIKNNTVEDHDYMTNKQLYDLYERHLRGQIVSNPNDPYNPYYYVDFENAKIRMIVLNSSDIFNDDGTYTERYSHSVFIRNRQLDWFANTALDLSNKTQPSTWGVIVFQHAKIDYVQNSTSKSLIGRLLSRAAKGVDINETYDVQRLLTYDSETEEWQEPSIIKQVSVSANFSEYGTPYIIGLFHGHDHFDTNYYYTYDNDSKKFPIVYFGADNSNIYKPYQYFPNSNILNAGWYEFTSHASDPTTHQPVTVYFYVSSQITNAYRLMYNDALYANGNTPSISVFNTNGEFVKTITARRTITDGETSTHIAFSNGRSRPIDIENCSCVNIDKENKKIFITPYGFGNDTVLEFS